METQKAHKGTNLAMDGSGWDNSVAIRGDIPSILSCLWSNKFDNFSESNGEYGDISEKVEQDQAFFASGLELLQGVQASGMSSNFDGVNEMVQMLAPTLDSMNRNLDLDFLQHQEAMRLAEYSILEASEAGAIWGHALSSRLCSSPPPPPITRTQAVNPFDSLAENFGSSEELRALSDITNDEEGLSTIFSSSDQNVHHLLCSGNISSGESENNVSFDRHHELASDQITKRKLEEENHHHFCGPPRQINPPSAMEGGFQISFRNGPRSKKSRSEKHSEVASIHFGHESGYEPDTEAMAQVKEMIYRAAALRPVNIGVEEAVEKPRRKNVRISSDPQTVAARHRRERISERLRVLQRLVPGGGKLDTASMLDEAANYLKFLKSQVKVLESLETFPLGPDTKALQRALSP